MRRRRGSALLEAALVVPVLALLGLGLTDAARLFHLRQACAGAARAAAQVIVDEPQASTERVVLMAWENLPGAVVTVGSENGHRRVRVEALASGFLHVLPDRVAAEVVVPAP